MTTHVSPTAKQLLCNLSVTAQNRGSDLIGTTHAAYFMAGNIEAGYLLHQLREAKRAFAELQAAMTCIDVVINELEGRAPVVKVDEQGGRVMDTDIKERWATALESGKYQQIRGSLRVGPGMCCLGVLCDIMAPESWEHDGTLWIHRGNDTLPNETILAEVGLLHAEADDLTRLNDSGESFASIAEHIRETL